MNFAAVVGVSLRSGYALPARHPDNGTPEQEPAEKPPIPGGFLSKRTRPALLFLAELAQAVAPGAHGVVLIDKAGWHTAGSLVVPYPWLPKSST
jgi:hypothetical protein